MNRRLDGERIVRGTHRRRFHVLPSRTGYADKLPLPTGTATLITPPATVVVLRAGYPTQIDDSAR